MAGRCIAAPAPFSRRWVFAAGRRSPWQSPGPLTASTRPADNSNPRIRWCRLHAAPPHRRRSRPARTASRFCARYRAPCSVARAVTWHVPCCALPARRPARSVPVRRAGFWDRSSVWSAGLRAKPGPTRNYRRPRSCRPMQQRTVVATLASALLVAFNESDRESRRRETRRCARCSTGCPV